MFKKCVIYFCVFTLAVMGQLVSATYAGAEKDTLIIGMQDDTVSLDPAKAYEVVSSGIIDELYNKLVAFREEDLSQPIPRLAESWEVGPDGKTWTFHLRQDVLFSTGNPVNADAVVFSLRRVIALESDSSWLLTQFGITEDSITKIDDDTVQIVLDDQYSLGMFFSCLTTMVGSILDPTVVMEHEQDGDMGSAWLDEHSAGSGRFILEERIPNESYTFVRNEMYWDKKPLAKQIIVKNIGEPFEQMVLLEKGEIDLAWDLQPDQVRRLQANPEMQIYETPTFDLIYVGMNVNYEPLGKPEVRDAIRYAIDYDGIIDFILQGAAVKIQTIIPRGILGYNPAMPYTFDLAKAKQLLTEAGYPNGFEVELATGNMSPWSDIALKIKSDLAKIGITVIPVYPDPEEIFELYFSQEGSQMMLVYWSMDYLDPNANAVPFAHCDSLGDDATIQMVAWARNYLNVETSQLVDQATRELDQNKREVLYKQITDIILDDGPYAILYSPIKQYGARLEVRNLLGVPSFFLSFPTLK